MHKGPLLAYCSDKGDCWPLILDEGKLYPQKSSSIDFAFVRDRMPSRLSKGYLRRTSHEWWSLASTQFSTTSLLESSSLKAPVYISRSNKLHFELHVVSLENHANDGSSLKISLKFLACFFRVRRTMLWIVSILVTKGSYSGVKTSQVYLTRQAY